MVKLLGLVQNSLWISKSKSGIATCILQVAFLCVRRTYSYHAYSSNMSISKVPLLASKKFLVYAGSWSTRNEFTSCCNRCSHWSLVDIAILFSTWLCGTAPLPWTLGGIGSMPMVLEVPWLMSLKPNQGSVGIIADRSLLLALNNDEIRTNPPSLWFKVVGVLWSARGHKPPTDANQG